MILSYPTMLPQLRPLLFDARPMKENQIKKKKTDQYSDLIHTGYSEPLGDLSRFSTDLTGSAMDRNPIKTKL